MKATTSRSPLAATRDHVTPRSRMKAEDFVSGQPVTVWACRQCNLLKNDMMPAEWRAFMAANPGWWKQPQFQRGAIKPKGARETRERVHET